MIERMLRQAFFAALRNTGRADVERGRLGKKNTDGSYTFDVPNHSGYVYVRVWRGADVTVCEAKYMNVQKIADLPVLLGRLPTGERYIMDTDPEYITTFMGSRPYAGVGPHSHRLGFGLEDMVEGLRIEPGAVLPYDNASMNVQIYPFFYYYNGVQQYYAGEVFDLTGYRPTTVGHHWWVKLGVNPATNAAVAVSMTTSQSTLTALTQAQLATIDFGDYIPLVGVQLQYGQTVVKYLERFADCRAWATGIAGGASHDLFTYLVTTDDGHTVTTDDGEPLWANPS